MRTLVWMIRELDITKEDDRKILLGELGKNNAVGQSKLNDTSGDVEFATDKQKWRMKKEGIPFDDTTTKKEASKLIKEKEG